MGEVGEGFEDGLGLLDVDPALGERRTGESRVSSASASRTTRCACTRVVRVAAACQFAVEDAAVSPGRSIRVAWDSARAFSSASWASALRSCSISAVVSVASIDHTGMPAISPS